MEKSQRKWCKMICKNCGKENKSTNIRCDFCNAELIDDNNSANKKSSIYGTNRTLKPEEVANLTNIAGHLNIVFSLLFSGLWILVAIGLIGFGSYSYISEHKETKDYDKTVATLEDYQKCRTDQGTEICNAIYEYQVNGITYTASPDLLSNRNTFSSTETVYYNPNNPSESIIYTSNINIIFIVIGSIILVGIIISFIYKVVKIKKNKNLILNNQSNSYFIKQEK